jgi:hypothetical protein
MSQYADAGGDVMVDTAELLEEITRSAYHCRGAECKPGKHKKYLSRTSSTSHCDEGQCEALSGGSCEVTTVEPFTGQWLQGPPVFPEAAAEGRKGLPAVFVAALGRPPGLSWQATAPTAGAITTDRAQPRMLVITCLTQGNVSHQERPIRSQEVHHIPQGAQIADHLLNSNDIKPGDDFTDGP